MSKFIELTVITTDKYGVRHVRPPELFNTDAIFSFYECNGQTLVLFKHGMFLKDTHVLTVNESYAAIKAMLAL